MTNIELHNNDCFEIMDNLIEKGVKVDAVITDPPYSITACKWDIPFDLTKWWSKVKLLSKDTTPIIVFGKQPFTTLLNSSNIKEFKYELIWKKQQATNPMVSKKRFLPIHENISIFYKKQPTYNPQMSYGHKNYSGDYIGKSLQGEIYNINKIVNHRTCNDGSRYPTTLLEYNNVRGGLHPTQKPLELIELLVKTFTNENDVVMDMFMGSGTTGVACKNLNRNFIGIEKDNEYYNIANDRIKITDEKVIETSVNKGE